MSPEPKKPIENLLEGSARTRRLEFGADPAMPNPMRARLQDEVARLERENSREAERSRGLSVWWPRIVMTTAVAAVLIGVSVVGLRHGGPVPDEKSELVTSEPAAKNPSDLVGPVLAQRSTEPAAKTEPATSLPLEQGAAALSSRGSFADANSDAAKSTEATKAVEENSASLRKFAQVAIAPAAAAPGWKNLNSDQNLMKGSVSSGAASSAVASARKRDVTNFSQQFSQKPTNQAAQFNLRLKQAVNVLGSFQMEQKGKLIRVVDADGSTYTGKIEALSQNDSRAALREQQSYEPRSEGRATQANKDNEAAGIEFHFQAAGYNGSLKKRLVFEGNYIIAAPSSQEKQAQTGAGENRMQVPARVVGTVKICGETPVQVDAVSVAQ